MGFKYKLQHFYVHKVRYGALMIIFLLLLIGWLWWRGPAQQNAAQRLPLPATMVETAVAKYIKIPNQVQAIATLKANDAVAVSPEVAGQISKILFKPGQWVKKGQVLIMLDQTQAKANYDSAKADYALSQAEYQRVKSLTDKGLSSNQSLDQAAATVQEKKASLQVAQNNLDKTYLRAPIPGRVGAKTITVGAYVQEGQSLVTLVNTKDLLASYQLPQDLLSELQVGQAISITTKAFQGHQFSGKVIYLAPQIDIVTRTIEVEAAVNNDQGLLLPGMYVQVVQKLGAPKQRLVVPLSSLVPAVAGQTVYKIESGKVTIVPVTVIEQTAQWAVLRDGLKVGDKVVTAGQQKLKAGSQVKEEQR